MDSSWPFLALEIHANFKIQWNSVRQINVEIVRQSLPVKTQAGSRSEAIHWVSTQFSLTLKHVLQSHWHQMDITLGLKYSSEMENIPPKWITIIRLDIHYPLWFNYEVVEIGGSTVPVWFSDLQPCSFLSDVKWQWTARQHLMSGMASFVLIVVSLWPKTDFKNS